VLPLFARSERLGFAVCELCGADPSAYETLTNQISTVMKLNGLVDEVRHNQRQLLDVAHQAGMAEIASGVLHGVGNLLTSVRVSAGELETLAGGRHVEGLARANELLAAHRDDLAGFFAGDPRAALVPEYYARIAEALAAERQRLRTEARALCEAVDLVRDAVRALQAQARDAGDAWLAEPVDVAAVVEGVLRIEQAELERSAIHVHRALAPLRPLRLPRARLVHVVAALVRNAVVTLQEATGERRLTVRTAPGPGVVRLEVEDSGRGLSAADRERVFEYGSRTPTGGRGFGLHTAANSAAQLGGALTADSPGPGRGTTFTLVLPAPESP
jgi:signal transduction histidine kinase